MTEHTLTIKSISQTEHPDFNNWTLNINRCPILVNGIFFKYHLQIKCFGGNPVVSVLKASYGIEPKVRKQT